MYYHRYSLNNNKYMGSTETINDDPDCGYTDVALPTVIDILSEIPVWFGDHWEIRPLINGEPG